MSELKPYTFLTDEQYKEYDKLKTNRFTNQHYDDLAKLGVYLSKHSHGSSDGSPGGTITLSEDYGLLEKSLLNVCGSWGICLY